MNRRLQCVVCDARYEIGPLFTGCPQCRERGQQGPLDFRVDAHGSGPPALREALAREVGHNIWRYADLLPVVDDPLSLDEGGTPLTLVRSLSERLGIRLYVKNETCNPTWSFKDRYAAVAVSVARQLGYDKIVCASTGNFGQAVAAYAALGGLHCLVLCPPTASELLRRVMRVHGADVVAMPKDVRAVLIERLVAEHGWCPVVAADPDPLANPFGTAGYKTIGYELVQQLVGVPHSAPGGVPDSVLVPVGAGDCLFGIWRGLAELRDLGLIDHLPRMVGCQVQAAAPLVHALEHDLPAIERVPERESSAVSIVEGHCGIYALQCVRASGGTAVAVGEPEVAEAQRLLARSGLFAEAASAATIAGALALHRRGYFRPGAAVVCVITGTGIKWPGVLAALADAGTFVDRADLAALAGVVQL
jgi:threonine synthase